MVNNQLTSVSFLENIQTEIQLVEERMQDQADGHHPDLGSALKHLLFSGGKRIRPAVALLTGEMLSAQQDKVITLSAAIELLHTATLVHDDAIDHSATRRGRVTVYRLWGDEQAVLLGDYLFAEAGGLCAATDNLRVIRKFSATLKTISSGEIDQAYFSFNPEQNRDNYFGRISKKTAALFSLSTESGAVLSDAPEESIQILVDYGYNLGLAFQIVDDILDFTSTEDELGKPVGSDLTQGTITLPSLMIMEKYPEDSPIIKLFENKGGQTEIDRAIEIVKNSTIIDECYEIAEDYCQKACRDIKKLPGCETRTCLEELAKYMTIRKK